MLRKPSRFYAEFGLFRSFPEKFSGPIRGSRRYVVVDVETYRHWRYRLAVASRPPQVARPEPELGYEFDPHR